MASLASLQSTMSSRSPSTFSEHFLGILGKGDPVPATDRVIVVKAGQEKQKYSVLTSPLTHSLSTKRTPLCPLPNLLQY
jgi:hypothetical protein